MSDSQAPNNTNSKVVHKRAPLSGGVSRTRPLSHAANPQAANDNQREARRVANATGNRKPRTQTAATNRIKKPAPKRNPSSLLSQLKNSKAVALLRRAHLGGLAKWKSFSGRVVRHRLFRYGVLLVMGFMVIWVPALTYVFKSEDVYKSNWSLIIPGSGLGSSLNIDSIGQTTTSVASPYASSSVDPKVNYKAIILSATVLRTAAESLGLTTKEYGKPLVKLIDQTAIMQITIADNTADSAHNKSIALFKSLESELERLRKNERTMIDSSNTDQLEIYKQQVAESQNKLLEYQTSSLIASSNKLELSLSSIDRLNNRRSELQLEIAAVTARKKSTEQFTGLTNEEAIAVVKLQQDIVLQELQRSYSLLYAQYLDRSSTLGARNPKVASIQSKLDALSDAIENRSGLILGKVDKEFVRKYSSVNSANGGNFYLDQITLNTKLASDAKELEQLDTLVAELETGIKVTTRSTAMLDELTRAYKVAETIYLSTLAKQDLGKSDVFASYPMIQLLVPPRKPFEPEKLHRIFAIVGALMGSSFIILALVILWKRNALLQKLSKRR